MAVSQAGTLGKMLTTTGTEEVFCILPYLVPLWQHGVEGLKIGAVRRSPVQGNY